MTEVNKKEIQRKIEELKQKLKKGEVKEEVVKTNSNHLSHSGKINAFYVLETKPLILSISLSIILLIGLYISETSNQYISQLTSWIFNLIY